MAARKEKSVKRWRRPGQVVLADALFHGYARCGYCGRFLGRDSNYNRSKAKYYYKCSGQSDRAKTGCKFKRVQINELDNTLWNALIEQLGDAEVMVKRILREEFILDKDNEELIALGIRPKRIWIWRKHGSKG